MDVGSGLHKTIAGFRFINPQSQSSPVVFVSLLKGQGGICSASYFSVFAENTGIYPREGPA